MKEILEHESWGSMYHEGNPGARILGEYVSRRKSWSTNLGGICIFRFFPKKHGARCMYHEPKIIKNPGKNVSHTIPQDFPSPRFFWKKPSKREKFPGERIFLENEFSWRTNFPGERILGKPPRKNCGEKNSGEKTPLENPNSFLCAGKVLVRKPPWKITICFYVLEKFWREPPLENPNLLQLM